MEGVREKVLRSEGIECCLSDILPHVEHRHCVTHLYNNFKKKYGAITFKDKMWKAATSTYAQRFERHMAEIKDIDIGAYNWLAAEQPTYLTRSHFRFASKCDILLNNICECFNAAIKEARKSPIIIISERIRCYMMKRFGLKRNWSETQDGIICPRIRLIVNKLKEACGPWHVTPSSANLFQVSRIGDVDQYVVDVGLRICTCRKWQLCGIPCRHAISAISYLRLEPENFVDECYSIAAYKRAYSPVIYPISGPDLWQKIGGTTVHPLAAFKVRSRGRPRLGKRRLEEGEVQGGRRKQKPPKEPKPYHLPRKGQKQQCRHRNKEGHNKRTCPQLKDPESTMGADEPHQDPVSQVVDGTQDGEPYIPQFQHQLRDQTDILMTSASDFHSFLSSLQADDDQGNFMNNMLAEEGVQVEPVQEEGVQEQPTIITCCLCFQVGHNHRMCPNPLADRLRDIGVKPKHTKASINRKLSPHKKQPNRPYLSAGCGLHIREPEKKRCTFTVGSRSESVSRQLYKKLKGAASTSASEQRDGI